MIEFTIKTLESINHQFSVEDETTVAQLKEQIREEMGIAIDSQRLIFCGRVLTDDRRLSEFDVHGKVIHLVPRPPPSPQWRNQAPDPRRDEMREALEEAQRVIDRMANQPTMRNMPLRHIWSLDPPSELVLDHHQALMMTPTSNRLEFIRRTIGDIRNSLNALFTHMANSNSEEARPPAEPMETGHSPSTETPPTETTPTETRPTEPPPTREQAEDMADELNDVGGGSDVPEPRRRRAMRASRVHVSRPRDLAQLIEELEQLQGEFAPFRSNYLTILRDAASSQTLSRDDRVQRQNIVELVCDVMHSFSHAYHAISDINITVGERFPRLISGFSAMRHPVPVQAHINVMQTGRRPGEANPGAAATATANDDATSAEPEISSPILGRVRRPATAAAATAPSNAAASEPNPLHNTTDVENLLRTLGQAHPGMEVVMSMEQLHPMDAPPAMSATTGYGPGVPLTAYSILSEAAPEGRATGTGAGIGDSAGVAAGAYARATVGATTRATIRTTGGASAGAWTRSRTGAHATRGFEAGIARNIVRGAGRAAPRGTGRGGPSFESITFADPSSPNEFGTPGLPPVSPGWSLAPDGVPTFTSGVNVGVTSLGPATFTIQPDGGVLLSSTTEENSGGAVATSEAIRNMFTSMFRQPLTPAGSNPPTNTATTTSAPGATATANNQGESASGRTSDAAWGLGSGQFPEVLHLEHLSTSTGLNQARRLGPLSEIARARTLQQAEERRRNAERANNPQGTNNQNGQNARNTRAHNLAMACLAYDRYLNCDSLHARQRLTERRAAYQELHNEQMRQRANRTRSPDIDHLGHMNPYFRPRYIACMMRLLCGRICIEGRLNAFLVTVARVLYLEPEGRPAIYDPLSMPREFLFVRMQMREYVQRLLETVIASNVRSPFEGVANLILRENQTFLNTMSDHTPFHPLIEPMPQLRSWLRARMPAIIACVMSESASDLFVSRFYAVCTSFFKDLCSLFLSFCTQGFEGFGVLFDAYFAQLTEHFEPTARDWIRLLARENLNIIRVDIDLDWTPVMGDLARAAASNLSHACCLYEVDLRSEDYRLPRRLRRRLPHICEHHQRTTMPMTTPPILSPPLPARNDTPDTPDTLESLPSIYFPTRSSSGSETSESLQPPEPEEHDRAEPMSNEDGSGSPPLREREGSADTVGTASHDSINRSPVQTRSAATSPRHETPPVSTPQSGRTELKPQCGINGPNDQNGLSGQAGALYHAQDRSQTSSPRSSPDSMRFVPPVMFLEHWGEEWVPVFTRDQRIQRERNRPQEPHSDAYLSGMPSRKRRCVRASRPPTTLDGFINESARVSTERSITLDPVHLRSAVRDSVRSLVRARADGSQDFDPVRYSSAARLLDQTKQDKKESENQRDNLD